MKRLDNRLEEQGQQMASICGLMAVHSERLHNIEDVCSQLKVMVTGKQPEVNQTLDRMDQLESSLDGKLGDVTSSVNSIKEELNSQKSCVKEVRKSSETLSSLVDDVRREIQQKMSDLSAVVCNEDITRRLRTCNIGDNITKSPRTTTTESDAVESNINIHTKSFPLPKDLREISSGFFSQVAELTTMLKTQEEDMRKFKWELRRQGQAILDQLIAESQVTRDCWTESNSSRKSYIFDMYIYEFSDWVGTDRDVYSRLWYIDRRKSYVKANILFNSENKMEVWLVHGSYPNVIGRRPCDLGHFQGKVTAINQLKNAENWQLAKGRISLDEKSIQDGTDGWYFTSGGGMYDIDISCDELIKRNLVHRDRLLLRFELKCI